MSACGGDPAGDGARRAPLGGFVGSGTFGANPGPLGGLGPRALSGCCGTPDDDSDDFMYMRGFAFGDVGPVLPPGIGIGGGIGRKFCVLDILGGWCRSLALA